MAGIYFDTSVYVALIAGDAAAADAGAALDAAAAGDWQGWTSGLVVAECMGAPSVRAPQAVPQALADERVAKMREYLAALPFRRVEMSYSLGVKAGELAARESCKGPDALHVVMAEFAGCEYLCSLDRDHLKLRQLPSGMRIVHPSDLPTQGTLFKD